MAYIYNTLYFKSGGSTYIEGAIQIYQDADNPTGHPPYAELTSFYFYSTNKATLQSILILTASLGGQSFSIPSNISWITPIYSAATSNYFTRPDLSAIPRLNLNKNPGDDLFTSISMASYGTASAKARCTGQLYMPTLVKITPPSVVKLNALNHFSCTSFTPRANVINGIGSLLPSYNGSKLYINESTPMDANAIGTPITGFYWYPGLDLAAPGDFTDNSGRYQLAISESIELIWRSSSLGGSGGVSLRCLSLSTGRTFEGVIQYNTVPTASCAPAVTMTATEVSGAGLLAQYGRYIKGKSRVQYSAAVTYKYGATERLFDLTVGSLYTQNKSLTFWPDRNGTATAHAEDDHGGETEVSATYRVYDYWTPALTQAIHRCRQDGTRDDAGSYCLIEWEINIAPLGSQNSRSLTIQHPAGTSTPSLNSYTASGELIVAADPERSYTITYTLSDNFETVTRQVQLSTAGVIMDIFRGGHGVSFGKVAEKDYTLEISSNLATILNTSDSKMINLVDALKALAQATGVDIYVH